MSYWTDEAENEVAYKPKESQAYSALASAKALERIADVLEERLNAPVPIVKNVTVVNPVTKLEAMSAKEKYAYIKSIKGATTLSEAEAILIDLWDLATS